MKTYKVVVIYFSYRHCSNIIKIPILFKFVLNRLYELVSIFLFIKEYNMCNIDFII